MTGSLPLIIMKQVTPKKNDARLKAKFTMLHDLDQRECVLRTVGFVSATFVLSCALSTVSVCWSSIVFCCSLAMVSYTSTVSPCLLPTVSRSLLLEVSVPPTVSVRMDSTVSLLVSAKNTLDLMNTDDANVQWDLGTRIEKRTQDRLETNYSENVSSGAAGERVT